MADEPQWDGGEPPLSAEDVAAGTFPTAFRGFDPVEVRAFLARVADELRAGAAREAELREAAAARVGSDAASHAEVEAAREEAARIAAELREAEVRLADQADRARLRGADIAEEAGRALATAQEEAARLVGDARDEGARLLRDAREEAGRLGSEADRTLAGAKEAAASSGIEERRAAERDAAVIRVKAREEADAIIEAAKARGREMVSEAQAARERMLKDLARRRRAAQAQLEHLKEARDRVLEHLRLARRAVDDITARFEPVESGWATGSPTTAPGPPGAGAQIDAPPDASASAAASAAAADDRPPPAEGSPAARSVTPAPAAPAVAPAEVSDAADDVRPATREERKSSALRILRRGRSQAEHGEAPRADEPVEGVRLIGPPPRVTPSEAVPPEPPPQEPAAPTVENVTEPAEEAAEPTGLLELADLAEEADDAELPDEDVAEHREPVRPGETLDELFARLRAGREETVAETADEVSLPEESRVSDIDEVALQRRDVAVEDAEAAMGRRLKRTLQDEQNSALDALRTLRDGRTVDALVGSAESQQSRFRRMAAVILGQAASAGAEGADVVIDDLVDALAAEVADSLRDRLGRALSQADAEELDNSAVAERLSAVYRDFKGQRAERLGSHYVIAAQARGAFAAVPEAARLRWVVDDGGPCPDCDDNALAGPVAKGEPYPTGQMHPPAHVGCRCVLVAAPGA
jgi:DivIVA domain-containing protein